MITTIVAWTNEIDDLDLALAEIKDQLSLEKNSFQHCVGLLTCHREFIESGVAEYLMKQLPFEIVGCTTAACGVNAGHGELSLSLCLFASNEVDFTVGWETNIAADPDTAIPAAIAEGRGDHLAEQPGLILPIVPLTPVSAETVMDTLALTYPNVPIFGTTAMDDTPDFSATVTMARGEISATGLPLIFCWGEVNPKFYFTSIPADYIQKNRGVITKSDKNFLYEINEMNFMDYMKSIGAAGDDGQLGNIALPLMIDNHDGAGVLGRAIHEIDEAGHAMCLGNMPEGAGIALGAIDYDGIVKTSRGVFEQLMADGDHHGLLVFPCASRFFVSLEAEPTAEMNLMEEIIGDAVPYMVAYSGGEVCPALTEDGRYVNHFHNFSLIVCAF